MNEAELLIALIKYTMTGEMLPADLSQQLDRETLTKVFQLARKHEVAPMAANALYKLGVSEPAVTADCQKMIFSAAMRYERMQHELEQTVSVLEQNSLAHIPLKGAVIRSSYPEPWLRTSCDIDILVKDPERAVQVLTENGYTYKNKGSHDYHILTPGGVMLELHYRLIETDKKVDAVLDHVWEHAAPVKSGSYCYVMDDGMFYFYHMAHMAKHFSLGGCGIRFFVDTWLLNRSVPDRQSREVLLQKGGLSAFAANAERLAQMWLNGGKRDSLLDTMEQFVLDGNIIGSRENKVKLDASRNESKIGFLLHRIFMPYDRMRLKYPVLEKWAVLLPVFWVVRWLELFFKRNKIANAMQEMKLNQNMDKDTVSTTRWMLEELGL